MVKFLIPDITELKWRKLSARLRITAKVLSKFGPIVYRYYGGLSIHTTQFESV